MRKMRFVCQLRPIMSLAVVKDTYLKVIWLQTQRVCSALKRSEISNTFEMSLEGSDLMQRVN